MLRDSCKRRRAPCQRVNRQVKLRGQPTTCHMIEVDSGPSAAHAPLGAGLVNIAIGPVIQCAEAASLGMVRARIARVACACLGALFGRRLPCDAAHSPRRRSAAAAEAQRSAAQSAALGTRFYSVTVLCSAARCCMSLGKSSGLLAGREKRGWCALVGVLVPRALWRFGALRTLCASPRLTPYM